MNEMKTAIEVISGDITKVAVDAIVNAANDSLMGGGGVDGAIHRAGGPAILEECKRIVERQGRCKIGEAVITTAGNLPAKYVIHTVGPIWRGGSENEPELLRRCYINSLTLAEGHGCSSIAFPNISTGVYGYPKPEAAQIAMRSVREFVTGKKFGKVVFVCFDNENFTLLKNLLGEV
jgi:O-acetyl-ADP-ribose deacetylase